MDFLGWAGAAGYLLNHAGFSLRSDYPRKLYFAVNLVSASLLVVSSFAISSWHPVANNGFWAVVSAIALTGGRLPGLPLKLPAKHWLAVCGALAAAALLLTDQAVAIEALGWVSVLAYAGAYLAYAARAVGRRRYLAINVAAAILQMPVLIGDENWPVLALQAAWAALSLAGLFSHAEEATMRPWPAAKAPLKNDDAADGAGGRRS